MKSLLTILTFCMAMSAFAQTTAYRFDDVDSISTDGKTIKVEDLRDGFESIDNVEVDDEQIIVSSKSKIKVNFRESSLNKLIQPSAMAIKIGGDGGGG